MLIKIASRVVLIFILSFSSCQEKNTSNKKEFETEINELISKMTLEEKIGQTNLRGTSSRTKKLLERKRNPI